MDSVRLGVLGTRRGMAFAEAAAVLPGVEIAALCGRDAERLRIMCERFDIDKRYSSYEDMLNDSGIDGVIVANYADEHAQPACLAMRAGKAVLSEVPACVTMAEAVDLIETVEQSGRLYMFGENFCYMAFVQEMRRLYERGDLGELIYDRPAAGIGHGGHRATQNRRFRAATAGTGAPAPRKRRDSEKPARQLRPA